MKGDEAFADRAFQETGEPRPIRRNLTVEAVAREVARSQGISPEKMMSLGQGRAGSQAQVLTAWVALEVAGISIARTARHFRRDTSTMARNVSRLEERKLADKRLRNLCDDLVTRLRPVQIPSCRTDPLSPQGRALRPLASAVVYSVLGPKAFAIIQISRR